MLAAGCSSPGTSNGPVNTIPLGTQPTSGSPVQPAKSNIKTGVSFTFIVPKRTPAKSAVVRKPQYIPSNSASLSVQITYAANATTGTPGTIATTINVDTSTCPVVGSGEQCTVSTSLLGDSYTADINAYDAANETGNILSQAVNSPFTVTSGQVNSVGLTLVGLAQSIIAEPDLTAASAVHFQELGPTPNYELSGTAPSAFTIYPVDADGGIIAGPGTPALTNPNFTSSNPAIVTAGAANGNTSLLQAQSLGTPSTITATATVSGQNLSATAQVNPVQEMYVAGGTNLDSYGMFSTGPTYLGSTNFGNGTGLSLRASLDKKSLVAFDNTGGRFYTLQPGSPAVVQATSPTTVGGADFVIDPSGLAYWVSNRNNNSVYEISSTTGGTLATRSVSQPIEIDFDASGNLFAAEINFNGTVDEQLNGGTAFATYKSGLYYPASLRVGNAANGGNLYVSQDNGSGAVVIYNGTGGSLGGPQATSFAFDAAGNAAMINGYANPVTLNFYPPFSSTPIAGRSFTFAAGRATGTFDFII